MDGDDLPGSICALFFSASTTYLPPILRATEEICFFTETVQGGKGNSEAPHLRHDIKKELFIGIEKGASNAPAFTRKPRAYLTVRCNASLGSSSIGEIAVAEVFWSVW
jgi:hypothetical protein